LSRKVFVLNNSLTIKDDDIEGILERTITKQGTSAKADVPRRYLGRRVYGTVDLRRCYFLKLQHSSTGFSSGKHAGNITGFNLLLFLLRNVFTFVQMHPMLGTRMHLCKKSIFI
jgi:putative transposon-encoded protein